MARPQWIADPEVDSFAMLGVFMHYTSVEPAKAAEMDLTVFIHWSQLSGMNLASMHPGFLTHVPCNGTGCERCAQGKGGYAFRWYHPAWREKYMALRRTDKEGNVLSKWVPPE